MLDKKIRLWGLTTWSWAGWPDQSTCQI